MCVQINEKFFYLENYDLTGNQVILNDNDVGVYGIGLKKR